MKKLITLCFATLIFCSVLPATSRGLNVQIFRPDIDGLGQITLLGTDALNKGQLRLAFLVNYVNDPIEVVDRTSGNTLIELVNYFLTVDLLSAYAVTDKLSFGFTLPFNVANRISGSAPGISDAEPQLGDLRFTAKYQLRSNHDDDGNRFGMATQAFITVPTGAEGDFFGSANVTGGLRFAVDHPLGRRHNFSANLGARFRETERILTLKVGHELLYGVGYKLALDVEGQLDFLLDLYGSATFIDFGSNSVSSPMEIVGAIRKQWVDPDLFMLAGIGRGVNNGYGTPDVRLFLGLGYAFGGKKAVAPLVAAAAPVAILPEPGQLQLMAASTTGQPINADWHLLQKKKTVSRGIGNAFMQEAPAGEYMIEVGAAGYMSARRVMVVEEGVTLKKTIILQEKVTGAKATPPLLERVFFDFDQSDINDQSQPALMRVVHKLNKAPSVKRLHIEAHTDSTGSEAYNDALSKRRAASVMKQMIEAGVAAERLTAEGKGEGSPIATNKTKQGRALNRRIDFVVLEFVGDKP